MVTISWLLKVYQTKHWGRCEVFIKDFYSVWKIVWLCGYLCSDYLLLGRKHDFALDYSVKIIRKDFWPKPCNEIWFQLKILTKNLYIYKLRKNLGSRSNGLFDSECHRLVVALFNHVLIVSVKCVTIPNYKGVAVGIKLILLIMKRIFKRLQKINKNS